MPFKDQLSRNRKPLLAGLACLGVLVICIGIFQWRASVEWGSEEAQNAFETAAQQETDQDAYASAVEEAVMEQAQTQEPAAGDSDETSAPALRVENNLLIAGDPNAPVTIIELSSLSCPHCASFHQQTLPSIVSDYVQTGKAQIVFRDFPLNQQALDATLLLRCMEPQARYNLTELLFEQQAQWAFDTAYEAKLMQYAALLGMPNDRAQACMNDAAAEEALIAEMQAAATRYNVTSTPTFIFLPGEEKVTGANAYGTFSTRIEALLANGN